MPLLHRVARGLWNGFIEFDAVLLGPPLRLSVSRGFVHFPFLSDMLARIPFSFGWKLRRALYARILPAVGRDVILHPGVVFEDPRTTIGDDVWIGFNATVLKGLRVGDGAVIAPGSLVVSDVPPGAQVAGNPAGPVRDDR